MKNIVISYSYVKLSEGWNQAMKNQHVILAMLIYQRVASCVDINRASYRTSAYISQLNRRFCSKPGLITQGYITKSSG